MTLPHSPITLPEHTPVLLPQTAFPESVGTLLWRTYGSQVSVEFPSPRTDKQWRLTAQGWVGHLPLTPDTTLTLAPKIPLHNLFGMLQVAYDLSLAQLPGWASCTTLPAFVELLAEWLAQRVLLRSRRGLHRVYVPHEAWLSVVRGRLQGQYPSLGETRMLCAFDTFSADIVSNQLLLWTLHHIMRTQICEERTQRLVRRAYRALRGTVTLRPFSVAAVDEMQYDRLSSDYRPMHLLCRFLLAHTGPTHQSGAHEMLPFLINMGTLFERFVARWLERHLPPTYELSILESSSTPGDQLKLQIDLVIRERITRKVYAVLDTKYKAAERPHRDDIYQIAFYAQAQHASRALLVYPAELQKPLDERLNNDIHLRGVTFDLNRPLEEAGNDFLHQLFPVHEATERVETTLDK